MRDTTRVILAMALTMVAKKAPEYRDLPAIIGIVAININRN